jgi:UDP-glucose 4-epimerase
VIKINILVTGGSGFIGSYIVDKLLELNYKVKIYDINDPNRNNVEFIKGDITDFNCLLEAMKEVDVVYHIAALSNVDKVAEQPVEAIDLNIASTGKVLEAARKSNVKRVIYASSYFVESGKGHIYTTTKAASEMLCKDSYNLYGLPYTILRFGTVYGPRSRGEDVVSIAVEKALTDEPFIITGDGSQKRNFIFAEDLAEGSVAALKDIAKNKTYVLEGSEEVTINQVAETVKKILGDLKIKYNKDRPVDYLGTSSHEDLVQNELNWEPKVDFEEGIKRYIEWLKTNG